MQAGGYKLLNLKGNKQSNSSELADPYNTVQKTVFIFAFASGSNGSLDRKVRRICEAFNADTFNIQHSNIASDLKQTEDLIVAQNNTLHISETSINEYFDFYQRTIKLNEESGSVIDICSYIEYIRLLLHKERAVQMNLNFLVANGS